MAHLDVRHLGRTAYLDALRTQEETLEKVRASAAPPTLLLTEHEPVYTIGRTKDRSSLRRPDSLPHPVVEISRGGKATYHGPGQLVGYPILDLAPFSRDLHRYLRFLEDFLIRFSAFYGVAASRREGLTGAWAGEKKLASIGVGVRHWVAMHGFAINVEPRSIEGFTHITPCGIGGVQMTDLSTESGKNLTVEAAARDCAAVFRLCYSEFVEGRF